MKTGFLIFSEIDRRSSKIKALNDIECKLFSVSGRTPKRGVGGSNPLGDGFQSVRKC